MLTDSIEPLYFSMILQQSIMTDLYKSFGKDVQNKPLEIKDLEMFDKMLEYIHMNPVMAGFVINPEDWKYSSARDFSGMKRLIELNFS